MQDGDDVSLTLLEKNMAANGFAGLTHVRRAKLVWGRDLDAFVAEHGRFDIVFGCDIVYAAYSLGPMWDTVDRMLADAPDALFVLSFTPRNVWMKDVVAVGAERGFAVALNRGDRIFHFKRVRR